MKMSFPGGQHLGFFHADGTEGQMCEMACSLNYEEQIDWRSEPDLDSESGLVISHLTTSLDDLHTWLIVPLF